MPSYVRIYCIRTCHVEDDVTNGDAYKAKLYVIIRGRALGGGLIVT